MRSHAANPVAEHRGGDVFRVYFGCRDAKNRSSVGFVDIDLNDGARVLKLSDQPVLAPGTAGGFDLDGISPGCLVMHQGRRYLYYTGWELASDVPWRNRIGLAVSEGADEPFIKREKPVLDLSDADPYSLSYPWVMFEPETGRWRMWYGSNLSWGKSVDDMTHVIKYAESADGLSWQPLGQVVGFAHPGEYAISRPCVVKDRDAWRMWYAWRGETYRIGYAESQDGKAWERRDEEAGIDVSGEGWDSDSVTYPCIFNHRQERFLLYNGNRFGLTGFGLARRCR